MRGNSVFGSFGTLSDAGLVCVCENADLSKRRWWLCAAVQLTEIAASQLQRHGVLSRVIPAFRIIVKQAGAKWKQRGGGVVLSILDRAAGFLRRVCFIAGFMTVGHG